MANREKRRLEQGKEGVGEQREGRKKRRGVNRGRTGRRGDAQAAAPTRADGREAAPK